MLCLVAVVGCCSFVGCSKNEQKKFMNKYGEGKAFGGGPCWCSQVSSRSSGIGHIDVHEVKDGRNRTAMQNAVNGLNSLFKQIGLNFQLVLSNGNYAYGEFWDSDFKYCKNDNERAVVARQVLGWRTLGLKISNTSDLKGYSIMYRKNDSSAPCTELKDQNGKKMSAIDYTNFDKHNIEWKLSPYGVRIYKF